MSEQQSTPLSAEDESWRDEDIYRRVKNGNQLGPMQRSRIIEIMDAARERPSALDVETELRKWARYARSEANRRMGNPDRRDDAANLLAGGIQLAWADRLDAILARLTEPDAGEGTERGCTCDGYGGHARGCALNPDTTEATLRAALLDVLRIADAPFSTSPEQRRRRLDRARAALQQPAVQPEGGLE